MTPACIGQPPEWWFPNTNHTVNYRNARRVCASCPAADRCLTDELTAMRDRVWRSHGMFAGTTPTEREQILAGMTHTGLLDGEAREFVTVWRSIDLGVIRAALASARAESVALRAEMIQEVAA